MLDLLVWDTAFIEYWQQESGNTIIVSMIEEMYVTCPRGEVGNNFDLRPFPYEGVRKPPAWFTSSTINPKTRSSYPKYPTRCFFIYLIN